MRLVKWSIFLGLVAATVWAAAPWGLRWHLNKQLALQGFESRLRNLSINYYAGEVILQGWELRHQGELVLRAEQLRISPDLQAWRAGRLVLRKLAAENLRLNWQQSDKGVVFAGQPATQWQQLLRLEQGAHVNSLALNKAELCQTGGKVEQCWMIGASQGTDIVWRWAGASWQVASRSSLVLSNTHLQNQEVNLAVFVIETSQMRDFVFSDDWSRIAQWQLNGVHLVERSSNEQKNVDNAYQTQAASILINDLGYKPGAPPQLTLGRLDMTRLRQTLHQNRSQVMQATAQLRKFLPITESFFNPKAPLTLSIAQTRIVDSAVAWQDESVQPAVSESLTGLNAEVGSLNSTKPNDPTSLTLITKLGERGELQVRGQIRPFVTPLAFDVRGDIRSLELAHFASYLAELYQEHPKEGELDGSITINSAANQLKLQGNLVLSQLRTEGAGNLSTQSQDLTMGRAFERLRGESQQVTVDWRFSTDLARDKNPLKNAMAKSFKTTLLRMAQNDWRAAGVNNLTGLGANPDGPLSFDQFRYSPHERDLSPDQQRRLDDLATLVNRRPKEKLKLCGIATAVEWAALYNHGAPLAQGSLVAEDQLQYLMDLAAARVRSIKIQLGALGISPQRFISCEPKVEMGTKIMSFVSVEMI